MGFCVVKSVSFSFLLVTFIIFLFSQQASFHRYFSLTSRQLLQLKGRGTVRTSKKEQYSSHPARQLRNQNDDMSILHQRQDPKVMPSNIDYQEVLKPIVIYSVFAGRRSTMSIQVEYLKELLKNNSIDEVHLWDYTCIQGTAADKQIDYLRTEIMSRDTRIYMIKPKNCNWKEYYDFYPRKLQPDDVLIKGDDDIVFIDTSRFQGFIDTIRAFPEVYLWSANVINNGISSSLQSLDGVFSTDLIKIEDEIKCPNSPMCLYRNNSLGQTLHELFINNPQPFFQVHPGKELRRIQGRISINFVAWSGRHAQTTAYYNNINSRGDLAGGPDEVAVTQLASEKFQQTLVVYMPLVVAHASYAPQNLHTTGAKLYKGISIQNNATWGKNMQPEKLELPAIANI